MSEEPEFLLTSNAIFCVKIMGGRWETTISLYVARCLFPTLPHPAPSPKVLAHNRLLICNWAMFSPSSHQDYGIETIALRSSPPLLSYRRMDLPVTTC